MPIKLSICIPTFNRGDSISYALDSIARQLEGETNNEIEVVISDNYSTDNTHDIVERYKKIIKNLIYSVNEKNIGADRNFLKAVSMANGEFCMLMGSDDAIEFGAINKILNYIGLYDIYLLDRVNMSFDMKKILNKNQKFLNAKPGKVYDFKSLRDFKNYYEDCLHIGSLFSYISTIIFNRQMWNDVITHDNLLGSLWVHVSKLNEMQKRGAKMQYIGKPYILNRTENDSFLSSLGYTKRRMVDLNFPKISDVVFCNSQFHSNNIRKIIIKQYLSVKGIMSDRRSSYLADGIEGVMMLDKVYENQFSDFKIIKLKLYFVRLIPLRLLDMLHRLFKRKSKI